MAALRWIAGLGLSCIDAPATQQVLHGQFAALVAVCVNRCMTAHLDVYSRVL